MVYSTLLRLRQGDNSPFLIGKKAFARDYVNTKL